MSSSLDIVQNIANKYDALKVFRPFAFDYKNEGK